MEITKDNIETSISIKYSIWDDMDNILISFYVSRRNRWVFYKPSVTYLSLDNTLVIHEYINKFKYRYIERYIESITGLKPSVTKHI